MVLLVEGNRKEEREDTASEVKEVCTSPERWVVKMFS
jgi:hypothetical protein